MPPTQRRAAGNAAARDPHDPDEQIRDYNTVLASGTTSQAAHAFTEVTNAVRNDTRVQKELSKDVKRVGDMVATGNEHTIRSHNDLSTHLGKLQNNHRTLRVQHERDFRQLQHSQDVIHDRQDVILEEQRALRHQYEKANWSRYLLAASIFLFVGLIVVIAVVYLVHVVFMHFFNKNSQPTFAISASPVPY
ncbi:hypothetical protein GGR57DRAFT_504701 [Xylariaceae sp. FL1272]|nr:hypothetical protein GGR57DRAFT_504701 [Xylariaceae sp. FL1272]